MNARDLVGAWSLVSFVARPKVGDAYEPWGPKPIGRLIYTAEGHIAVVMTKPDRVRFASEDPTGGTLDEIKEAFEGLAAYAGSFEFDEATSVVRHHVDVAHIPNWQGASLQRFAKLQGNELTLRTAPTIRGGEVVLTLVWRRNQLNFDGCSSGA